VDCKTESGQLNLAYVTKRKIYTGNRTRSQAVARIADRTASQHLWCHVMSSVTWPCDTPYVISYWWSLGTSLYLQPFFMRHCTLSALGSRVWSFVVTWRHRSLGHLITH